MGVTCLLPQNVKHNEFVLTLDHGVNWGCRIPVHLHKENNDLPWWDYRSNFNSVGFVYWDTGWIEDGLK